LEQIVALYKQAVEFLVANPIIAAVVVMISLGIGFKFIHKFIGLIAFLLAVGIMLAYATEGGKFIFGR
jgi:hypothetical protein